MADGMKERDEELFERLMADTDSDWPDRLLHDLARKPLVDESAADFAKTYASATRTELTERELEVLNCASHGMDAEHIAGHLFIALGTVKAHLKAARYRLKAKNTAHACCLAIRQGLFE
jgi:DNA-binding NarL/FixJ family response regulator